MREIKFRAKAMSKKITGWHYGLVRSIAKDGTGFLQDQHRNCVHINIETLGQYTGLKDKNDKEIYEGDIVRLSFIADTVGVVMWETDGWKIVDEVGAIYQWDSRTEVIGNIYENPGLLGQI